MEVKPLMDLHKIVNAEMPFLVLSDNMRSWVSARIKCHEHGSYNHMMWMIREDYFLSQNALLQEQKVEKYFDGYRIKLWHNPNWTQAQRVKIISMLVKRLNAPWYQRLYDPLQIIGIRMGIKWLQIPGIRICSDHSDILRLVDPHFNLKTGSSPTEVNKYLESNPAYKCYGRYMED